MLETKEFKNFGTFRTLFPSNRIGMKDVTVIEILRIGVDLDDEDARNLVSFWSLRVVIILIKDFEMGI